MYTLRGLFGSRSRAEDAAAGLQTSQSDKKGSLGSETGAQKGKKSSTRGRRSSSVKSAKTAAEPDDEATTRRRAFEMDQYCARIENAEEKLRNKDSKIAVQKCEIDCLADALGVLYENYFDNSENRVTWQREKIESLYSVIKVYGYRETLSAAEIARLERTVHERDGTIARERDATRLLEMELENAKRRLDLHKRAVEAELESAMETTRSARLESDRLRAESELTAEQLIRLRETLRDERRANQRLLQKVEWLQACGSPAEEDEYVRSVIRSVGCKRRPSDSKLSSRYLAFSGREGVDESSDSSGTTKRPPPPPPTTACAAVSDSNCSPGSGKQDENVVGPCTAKSDGGDYTVGLGAVRSLSAGDLSLGSAQDENHTPPSRRSNNNNNYSKRSPPPPTSPAIFSDSDLSDDTSYDRTTIATSSSRSFAESKEPSHDCISNYLTTTSYSAADSPGSKETLKGETSSPNEGSLS